MRAPFLLLAFCYLPTGLFAQLPNPARQFKPKTCPAADSALGSPTEKIRHPILGLYSQQTGESMIFSADPWAFNGSKPLRAVWVTTHFPGDGPVDGPTFGFQVRMEDTTLRAGPTAHLRLQVDSGDAQDIGEMQAQRYGSGGRKVDQVLTIGLTADESRWLAGAREARGTIGGTAFSIPNRALEGIRAVYVASSCGVKLR